MDLDVLLKALEATAVATAVAEGESLFPWLESIHVLAITLVVGTIMIIDLRLIGIASLDRAVSRLTRDVLPCTWAAFAVAAISGGLLFSSKAATYGHNVYFQAKLAFLLLAGINMVIFHLYSSRGIDRWGAAAAATPLPARIAGAVSLLVWIGVVTFGRWVGFTLH
jgi:hypothetical protein